MSSNLKDVPGVPESLDTGLKRVLKSLRDHIRELRGYAGAGSASGRAVTLDDVASTISTVVSGATTYTPDLTPPPTPSGVVVGAGIDFVGVQTDAPTFATGHGYGRTIVYGAKHTTGGLPVFADAVVVHEFVGAVGSFPSEPATEWRIWVKWRSVDGVESTDPDGGTNGRAATTGQDVRLLLDALTQAATTASSPYSRISFRADMFYIGPEFDFTQESTPTGTVVGQLWFKPSTNATKYWDGAAWQAFNMPLPFLVQTVPTTINGVPIPAGVYMDAAYIYDLTASIARLGNAWITNLMVASVAATKITAGSISTGEYIQSTGYIAGSTGWKILGNGNAEFSGVVVRGTIYASAGLIGGITIGAHDIRSSNYVPGTSGFRINDDGSVEIHDLTLAGTAGGINVGTSGYIRGGQTAYNTGTGFWLGYDSSVYKFSIGDGTHGLTWDGSTLTIKGTLNGADGTFSGTLTADAVNAVNTINLAGDAVMVPKSFYDAGSVSSGELASLTLEDSTGANVFLSFCCTVTGDGTDAYRSPETNVIVLKRDGTEIARARVTLAAGVYLVSGETDTITPFAMEQTCTVQFTDTDGETGDLTYTAEILSGGMACSLRSMFLVQVQKWIG